MDRRHAWLGGLLVLGVGAFVALRGGEKPKTTDPAPSSSASSAPTGGDPLDAIRWDDAPLDWRRPIAATTSSVDGYAGSAECTPCHTAIAERFAGHAMARTGLRLIDAPRRRELTAAFDTHAIVRAGSGSTFAYRPFKDKDRYFIEELVDGPDGRRAHSWTQELTHTFTSGAFGLAFGFRSGGFVYQVPLDWYAQSRTWGFDPGFKRNARFSRPFAATCVACHSEPPRHRAGSDDAVLDPAPAGVGCERCHGPGKRHVESSRKEDIVNPTNLSTTRQLDVCAQCHLQGTAEILRAGRKIYDVRAGEPLHAYRMNYVEAEPTVDWFQLTSHSDRLTRSACFRAAKGKLVCTTCHEPHKTSRGEPASHWRKGCLVCHTEAACTAPAADRRAKDDACADCHMRKDTPGDFRLQVSDIHLPITDHWIRKRVSPPTPPDAGARSIRLQKIESYALRIGDVPVGDDLVAIEAVAEDLSGMGREALPKLASAVTTHPQSPDLYDALASRFESRHAAARSAEDRRRAAVGLRHARAAVVRFRPDDVGALVDYARACFMLGTEESVTDAHASLDRALRVMPDHPAALLEKGGALFRAGRIDEAGPVLERAVDAGPDQLEAHVLLGVMSRDAGALARAVERFESARKREPRDVWLLDQLATLYERLGRTTQRAELLRVRSALGSVGPTRVTRWLAPSQR